MCQVHENSDYIKSQFHILESLIQERLDQHDLVGVFGHLIDLKPDREASTAEALSCFDDLKGLMFEIIAKLHEFLLSEYTSNLEA